MSGIVEALDAAQVAIPLAAVSLLALFTDVLAIYVAVHEARRMKDGQGLPGHVPQLLLFAVVVNALAFAILGIGKAYELVEDAGGTLALILFTSFGPWLGYKAITRKWSGKTGAVDVSGDTP